MFFKLKSYLLFLIKSINQNRVITQFVLNLLTKCFYKKTDLYKSTKFIHYKKELLKNKSTIRVTDFGAGSTIFSSQQRQISKIAQIAGITNKRANLLIRFIEYTKPKNILEIGTSLGLATSAMAISSSNSNITTLEGCPETAKIAQQQFKKFKLENINLIVGDFSETLPKILKENNFDFIYFDGNHQKKATLTYFNYCQASANENSIFIFDDIYWSKEMHEAWSKIKKHPKVTITINTFQWGIVFFKKQQNKEHFTIRI